MLFFKKIQMSEKSIFTIFRDLLQAIGSLKGGSEAIARGIAIFQFIGLTPPVGFQTVLIVTACILFVLNRRQYLLRNDLCTHGNRSDSIKAD
jgi:uncharacterized protein (DUF2062 family)